MNIFQLSYSGILEQVLSVFEDLPPFKYFTHRFYNCHETDIVYKREHVKERSICITRKVSKQRVGIGVLRVT